MDISETLAPNSDQLDAIDLAHSGPRIFTVTSVDRGNAEQPVNVHLAEFPRPWRPGKTMRRVLASCWGVEASTWAGRRVELYCDPDVSFGREKVGGTRIKRLSHIDGPQQVQILVSKGRPGKYRVDPLPDDAPAETLPEQLATLTPDDISHCDDLEQLRNWHRTATPELREHITTRANQLKEEAGR